ncbi:helix-turn-helix domain-containing protein [Microbacterium sp. zg.B48]|uniref:IclR family transcriptional regulator domain-containing protein n=1 Tax=unclassified Microbacterium TaxID=2609290 RepID=UPI00214B796A|nr:MULTISPECIES: IclR family transcriptional regulator C-terminal domain-containing protein [unclassified Microbacterium]MCR2763067.1 helix-turn-helix domain-containing protein [Microbacterium sp. zg.B48]MCR2808618.1 helix-turn-helix domain-containing protein [Microbacterium sp. zg.B185]WIM18948.1 IclR family transcriptional regulator C-terminal domain-containing protein [Microbacterium sp. zg-B185]
MGSQREARVYRDGGIPVAEDRSRDRIQSIERGIEVLRAFGGHDAALSPSEIVARVGLPRPVVRRILLTFAHLGYARSQNGMWSLTPRILELSAGYFSTASLPEVAYPFMGEVVERTGETCSVGVLDGVDIIHVARVEDRRPLPDAVRVGMRLPAHATALGKVLLANAPDTAVDDYFRVAPLEGHTPQTIVDESDLRDRLALVRERGFDVSVEELHPGMLAAAVPILVDSEAVGALAASSTTVRESEQSMIEDVVPVLRDAAVRVARTYRSANPQLFRAARA